MNSLYEGDNEKYESEVGVMDYQMATTDYFIRLKEE